MLASPEQEPRAPELIGPGDPPAFDIVNPDGDPRHLICCDHAGVAIPRALGTLGLGPAELGQHIAYDIGILGLVTQIASLLNTTAILANYSRLVIDCNRSIEDSTSICAVSDGVAVPGNADLGVKDRDARIKEIFTPYHDALDDLLRQRQAVNAAPALISLHSYTPHMDGYDRPWHLGILSSDADRRFADRLLADLAEIPDVVVGDNKPYSGASARGYTIQTHAVAAGIPNVLIEVRQDLLQDEAGTTRWARLLADHLEAALSDPTLSRDADT